MTCQSVFRLSDVVYDVSHSCLLPDPGVMSLVAKGDAQHNSLHFLCTTASASIWAVVNAQVSLPYVITGSTYSLNTFFLICMLALQLLMMLSTLSEAAHPKVIRLLISGIRSPSLETVFPR